MQLLLKFQNFLYLNWRQSLPLSLLHNLYEKGQMKSLILLDYHKVGLFFPIWLQGPLGLLLLTVQQIILLLLLNEEQILLTWQPHLHAKFVCKGSQYFPDWKVVPIALIKEKLNSGAQTLDDKPVNKPVCLQVLQHFHLRVKVTLMQNPQEMAKHVSPKLIVGIGLVYGRYDVVFEWFDHCR
jgi:hypothetical protein